jgi:predicted lipoprotein with Yx(FWY)xxD motif
MEDAMHRVVRLAGPLALASLISFGSTLAAHATAPAAPALVKTTPAKMLVDGRGMTLYVYAPDPKGKSVCYGECAEYWPPAIVPSGTTVPAAMPGLKGTFGVTMRTNGQHQLTYDGAPLYMFVKDKKPGDMTGQGLDVAGGYWWLVVVKSTPAAASASSGNPGY